MDLDVILSFVLGVGATATASGLLAVVESFRRRGRVRMRITRAGETLEIEGAEGALLGKLVEAQRDLAQAQQDIDEVSVALQSRSDK